jgi:hypothetical protein
MKDFHGDPVTEVVYNEDIPSYGDLMTVKEYLSNVKCGGFIDYDGFGQPAKDGKMADVAISPSSGSFDIPEDATHIVWYNR